MPDNNNISTFILVVLGAFCLLFISDTCYLGIEYYKNSILVNPIVIWLIVANSLSVVFGIFIFYKIFQLRKTMVEYSLIPELYSDGPDSYIGE